MTERRYLAAVTIAARGCAILADLIADLVTWPHARETVRLSRGVDIRPTYGRVFLQDGSFWLASALNADLKHRFVH
ncbi:hypothetical protein C8Q80DRAFT_1267873 [Daedaleopsis nitida]|nr:hypothetical protein C8Q80DRAFT_1267873 [Daedaleopsis nitida]